MLLTCEPTQIWEEVIAQSVYQEGCLAMTMNNSIVIAMLSSSLTHQSYSIRYHGLDACVNLRLRWPVRPVQYEGPAHRS
jgi:hypothetical protein